MSKTKYAFIIKAPGYSVDSHKTEMSSNEFYSVFVGVSGIEEACSAVQQLIEDDVSIIELCGGFSQDKVERLRLEVRDKASVGLVMYE